MKYRVKVDSKLEPKAVKGTVVYPLIGWDYGSANEDTRVFDIEHISVTLKENGDYPYFTIPLNDLESFYVEEDIETVTILWEEARK